MPYGKKATLVAYQKSTGNVVWTTPNPRGVDEEYESPILTKLDGRDVILASGKQGALLGADARTGAVLFTHQVWPAGGSWWEIPSATPIGDGRIFFTCGYGHASVMIKVTRLQNQQYQATQLWANRSMGSKCGQALLYNGYIYGNSSDVGGGLRCITLDGKVVWDSKANGRTFDLGNVIIADGLLYAMNGQSGELVMAEASPNGYKELGHAQFLGSGEDWAPMAFANGKLVVRDYSHSIVCLDVTAAGNGVAAH